DTGPELVAAQPRGAGREGRFLARVAVLPLIGADGADRVRGALEDIVLAAGAPFLDRADLLADADQRVAEAIKLGLRFAFGRLDHKRARHGPRHGRRVEAVVHEALGDVVHLDAGRVVEGAAVEDELVRATPVAAGVEHVVM